MQVQFHSRSLGYGFSDMLPYTEIKSLYTAIPEVIDFYPDQVVPHCRIWQLHSAVSPLSVPPALQNDNYTYVGNNYR